MEPTSNEYPIEQRVGGIGLGIFLFCFGLPFTLVPVLLWPVAISIGGVGMLFMFCFSIPFLLAGLGVQYGGVKIISESISPKMTNQNTTALLSQPMNVLETHGKIELDQFKIREDEAKPTNGSGNFWDNVQSKSP